MSVAVINNSTTTLGKSFQATRSPTADGAVLKDPTPAAAKTGTLSTRTSGTAGTLTMADGHGITTGAHLHLYWAGGACSVTVGTVSGDSVPFTGGVGTALPIATTAITAMVPTLETFPVVYSAMQALLVGSSVPALVEFQDSTPTLVKQVYVGGPADSYTWDNLDKNAPTNPFGTSTVASAYMSHSSSAGAKQVNAVALTN